MIHQAHHVFPQKFRSSFSAKGINIDNPRYGAWWENHGHLSNAYNYNAAWQRYFLRNPDATATNLFDFGKSIMEEYKIPINY